MALRINWQPIVLSAEPSLTHEILLNGHEEPFIVDGCGRIATRGTAVGDSFLSVLWLPGIKL